MKALKFLFAILISCFLAGCFEMNEEIIVNQNGSGNMNLSMDMGQMLEMIQTFMGPEELQKADLEKAKDTTIQMKDLVDTAKDLSQDQKTLLRDGSINMKMSLKEKLFKVDMHFPFKTMDNLQKLYDNINEGSSGMSTLLKGLSGNSAPPGGQEPQFNQIGSYFDLSARKNSISRKLNLNYFRHLST